MTGNIAVDVTIGLVFIFLLYSLLASIVAEMVASFLGLRARNLHKGIVRMLEEEQEGLFKEKWPFVFNGIRDAINDFHESFCRYFNNSNYNATEKFYDYPLVKYLGRDKHFSKPSYISAQTFSKVIIDLLKKGQNGSEITKIQEGFKKLKKEEKKILKHKDKLIKILNTPVKEKPESAEFDVIIARIIVNNKKLRGGKDIRDNSFEKKLKKVKPKNKLQKLIKKNYKESFISGDTLTLVESFLNDSNNDIEKFKILLENWYDTTMERAASWYKRKNQFILMIIGFGIAVSFNVSTIEIVNKLSKDDKVRDQMLQLATASLKDGQKWNSLVLKEKEKLNEDIYKTNSILGFNLPDSLDAKIIAERPFDSVKIACIDSTTLAIKSKPNYKLIDSIYLVKFPNVYLAEHAESYYFKTKKSWRNLFKKSFNSIKTWITRDDNNGNLEETFSGHLYLDKAKYFWAQFWGYLLTALAISLGAAFWFDLLNKLITMRSSVKAETKVPETNSKDNKLIKG